MAFDHIVWSGSSFGNASLIDFHCLVFPFLFLIKSGASSFNLDFCTELLICLNNNLTVHCKLDIVNSTGWPGLIEFDLILLDIWTCHWPLWRSKLIHLPQNVYRVSLFYRYSTMSIFFRCRCQCNPNRMKTKRVIGTKKRPTNKNNTIESSGCFVFFLLILAGVEPDAAEAARHEDGRAAGRHRQGVGRRAGAHDGRPERREHQEPPRPQRTRLRHFVQSRPHPPALLLRGRFQSVGRPLFPYKFCLPSFT